MKGAPLKVSCGVFGVTISGCIAGAVFKRYIGWIVRFLLSLAVFGMVFVTEVGDLKVGL